MAASQSSEGAETYASRVLRAEWIAPPETAAEWLSLFRKEFSIGRTPSRAKLRIIGLGDYDPRINGQRLSDTGINQPWSQYDRTLYYREFDLTEQIKSGNNCVGVMLANSFWDNHQPPQGRYYKFGPQRTAEEPLLLAAEISLEHEDGSVERVATDASWRVGQGPVIFSHIFAGEDYDVRLEQPGWDRPGYDDTSWQSARLASPPAATLRPQDWPPIKAVECFQPESVSEPAEGVFLYSFPQNCAAQLKVQISGGGAGDPIKFRCGEHKNQEGRLFGHYVVESNLTTDGSDFNHQWLSFYLGMQFVEVAGAVPRGQPNPNSLPVIESMELVHVRTGLPLVGEFSSSSELFNGTHHIVDWAMRSNMNHVLTDCPHREKLGWLEVSYLMAPSFQYRYDCRNWFDKILQDIRDAQLPDGRVLTVAPSYPAGKFPGKFNFTVEWGAAAVLLPWKQYEWTGDREVLRENYQLMRGFVDYLGSVAEDGIAPGGLGDWYDYGHGEPPGPSRFTPPELTATATWALCADRLARAAAVLDLPADAEQYRQLHAQISADFQRKFRDPSTGSLAHLGSPQCANAIALAAGVVPENDREHLVREIIEDLETRDWQQTPGDVGHVYFIRALAEAGHSDVLHRVYSREGKGSYGGILAKGLTSMPETWDAMMDGYQSLNHCMLGHVMGWYYGYVAGIRQQAGSVGWSDILIAPNPGPLSNAEASLTIPAGKVASRWKVGRGQFELQVEVPLGVSATAILPSGRTEPLQPGTHTLSEPFAQPDSRE